MWGCEAVLVIASVYMVKKYVRCLLALLCDPEDGCFELMRNIGDLLSD
jgi:hypothetical protein